VGPAKDAFYAAEKAVEDITERLRRLAQANSRSITDAASTSTWWIGAALIAAIALTDYFAERHRALDRAVRWQTGLDCLAAEIPACTSRAESAVVVHFCIASQPA